MADAPQRIPARVGQMGQRLGHLPEDIDAAMADGYRARDLAGNRLRIAEIGKDGDRQVTVADASPFAERVVVGSHHVQLEGGIAELEVIAAGRIGKEHFRIDAIAIQSLQPFPRIIGGPWHLLPSLGIRRKRIAHQRGAIAHAFLVGRPIVNSPPINAASVMFDLHDLRNAVLPFACRHPPGEVVAVERGVRVCAYESVLDFHSPYHNRRSGEQASALRSPGSYLPAGSMEKSTNFWGSRSAGTDLSCRSRSKYPRATFGGNRPSLLNMLIKVS